MSSLQNKKEGIGWGCSMNIEVNKKQENKLIK
jgi:hypothetical protein